MKRVSIVQFEEVSSVSGENRLKSKFSTKKIIKNWNFSKQEANVTISRGICSLPKLLSTRLFYFVKQPIISIKKIASEVSRVMTHEANAVSIINRELTTILCALIAYSLSSNFCNFSRNFDFSLFSLEDG